MRAYLRSARIAPKKANVIAQMVRGLQVPKAIDSLEHTQKKGAKLILLLLKSAVANATHNDKQRLEELVVRTIIVNQAQGYRRGVSMARGRMRPIRKFLSHIEIVLGVGMGDQVSSSPKKEGKASQKAEKTVKEVASQKPKAKKSPSSSSSSK